MARTIKKRKEETKKSPEELIKSWNETGSQGFYNWVKDFEPKIKQNNIYKPIVFDSFQNELITEMLSGDYSVCLLQMPRRHGKSNIMRLIVLWLLCSRPHYEIYALGNTEEHSQMVQLNPIKGIIRYTPKLLSYIGERNIYSSKVYNKHLNSTFLSGTTNLGNAFGMQLNCLWVSDFHAQQELDTYSALQASLLDSEDRWTLIDSNVDIEGGHVHCLETEAATDAGIYCNRVEYNDFEDYINNAPRWINRDEAKRYKSLNPLSYERDLLGKRSSAINSLFPTEIIKRCFNNYTYPVENVEELLGQREYSISGGLDRSRKLFGGDNTIWTVVLKTTNPETQENEYYLLNQVNFTVNTAKAIKKQIQDDDKKYGLDNLILENHEVSDLVPWLSDQNIAYELVNPTNANQNISFVELYRIADEGRLNFPESLKDLISEMQTFGYSELKNSQYSFGHIQKKFKDDRVYSLNWAIYATRQAILKPYTLDNIFCNSKSKHKKLCFLIHGELELPCKDNCIAYQELKQMHDEYKRVSLADISITDFYDNVVELKGSKIYQNI